MGSDGITTVWTGRDDDADADDDVAAAAAAAPVAPVTPVVVAIGIDAAAGIDAVAEPCCVVVVVWPGAELGADFVLEHARVAELLLAEDSV